MSVSVFVSSFAGVDVGAKIAAAYASLPAQGGEIIVDLAGSIATGVLFGVSGKTAILTGFGNALILKYTGTGPAITFNNGPAFDFCSRFEALTLTGPGNTSSTVGLQIGGTNGAIGLTTRNFLIQGFGVGVKTQSNTFLTQDRNSGSNYARLLFLQGGVVQMVGIGMFTPAGVPLSNAAFLANAVNVSLLGFNDLSGAADLLGGNTLSIRSACIGWNRRVKSRSKCQWQSDSVGWDWKCGHSDLGPAY